MIKKNKLVLIGGAAVIIILALILFAGGGKYSSPEKTISTMFKAIERADAEAFLDCFTEDSKKNMEEGFKDLTAEQFKAQTKDFKMPDYEVIEKTEDTAVVKSKEEEEGDLVMKKEDGKWKVDLEATIQRAFENISY